MSYDVHMEIDTGRQMAAVADAGNYTSNVSPMWRKAIPEEGVRGLHGLTGEEALWKLRIGIEYMETHMDKMRAMNPTNGWGNAEGALSYLEAIRKVCEEHPKAKVYVSC